MKLQEVPKFVFVLLGLIIVTILFYVFVGLPLMNNYPKFEKDHNEAVAQVQTYEEVLKNQKTIEEKIKVLNYQWERKQKKMFVDAESSVEDLQQAFKKMNIDMLSFSRGGEVKDSQGRTTQSGVPLYTINLSYSFKGTVDTALELLDYVENKSNGCYFVSNCVMTPVNGSKTYDISINMTLYYFNNEIEVVEPTKANKNAA